MGQVLGEYEAKDASLFRQDKATLGTLSEVHLEASTRYKNSHADSLATLATMFEGDLPRLIIVEELDKLRWKD